MEAKIQRLVANGLTRTKAIALINRRAKRLKLGVRSTLYLRTALWILPVNE